MELDGVRLLGWREWPEAAGGRPATKGRGTT
jgi:hypothetical protein